MSELAIHKAGTTFDRWGQIVAEQGDGLVSDLTGWAGFCQVRTARGVLIADCVFSWIDATLRLANIHAEDTSNWPEGMANIDILLRSPAGQWASTPTGAFRIVSGVTRRPAAP